MGQSSQRRVKIIRKASTTFSAEFKREAVRLLEQGYKEAAQLLDIRRKQLYKWHKEIQAHGETAVYKPNISLAYFFIRNV